MYIYIRNLDCIPMNSFIAQLKRITNLSDHVNIDAARQYIISNIEFRGTNVWILIFAIVMASVGLNVNSIPVVIGAMLISPLMGPIMGVGLALGINDTTLLKKSFKNLLIMTFISIVASTLFFLITPLALEAPTELLARTNPTIYDVFIALFGGLAVIVEVCKKEKGTVIAGAAIATALMPPLCTAGYGVANGNIVYFFGAFYLYFINSVFIALATFLTVRYLQFPMVKFSDPHQQRRVHRSITLFTLILILPSIYSAITVIKENKFNQVAKKFISDNKNLNNSYIYDYQITHRTRKPSTITISIAGETLTQKEINQLHESLARNQISKEQLLINQKSTFIPKNISDQEVVQSIFERNEQEVLKRENLIRQMEEELKKFKNKEFPSMQVAREIATQYPQVQSITLARGEKVNLPAGTNKQNVQSQEETIAIIKFRNVLSPEEFSKLKQWLAIRLEIPDIRIIDEK